MAIDDTIYALASAHGPAGVAVIRVSGVDAVKSAKALGVKLTPRTATYTPLMDSDGQIIDQAVVTYFKAPHSYTGEDVVEYALHGSQAVINRFYDVCSKMDNHRMAEAGEFTKRAFLNDKMDLTAAEAVNDLIYAETEAQRSAALDQMDGKLNAVYMDWTTRLSKALAHQEAEIEFPDEDLPDGLDESSIAVVKTLIEEMDAHLNDNHRGERLRTGMQIAIIGAPNAGKSSLINQLARREVAIVSDIAGTTRDVVEVALNLGGYPVLLCDTAGLRDSPSDAIEAEGIKRAIKRADEADAVVAVLDGAQYPDFDEETLSRIDDKTITIVNKIDLNVDARFEGAHRISCESSEGIDGLIKALTDGAKAFFDAGGSAPTLTRRRHRENVETARKHLDAALTASLPELAAEDLRQALLAIGRITGRVDVEQLLDIVFRDFCIGK